jgi:23S rRNA pseudouridine1911/1915/1917 synthase
MEQTLNVLFEDSDLAVIDKPAGIIVDRNGTNTEVTIQDLAEARWPRLKESQLPRSGIVHRLDKETSGLLLLALNDESHDKLSQLFKNREITKIYSALVEGNISENLEIELPIGRSNKNRKKMSVESSGKAATTRLSPRTHFDSGFTLVEIELLTGRTHQIRVHLSHIGHPVAGDRTYGGRKKLDGLDRPFLHASKLSFGHPRTGKRVQFVSELPASLQSILKTLAN